MLLVVGFSPVVAAANVGIAPIVCIGDSLTFGAYGDGIDYPSVLAAKSGVRTLNLGLPGWIPRHIMYHVLLHDAWALSRQQLEEIPPAEYEDRRNQPEINGLRTFLTAGQTVWVKLPAGVAQYRWDPTADEDTSDTIKPTAVGDRTHHPLVSAGRWQKVERHVNSWPPTQNHDGVVFWIGANGMEADDIMRSLNTLIQVLAPRRFLILGLINRVDPDVHPAAIASWTKWIKECNNSIRRAYPDHFLDLQSWMMATGSYAGGGYRPRDWIKSATAEDVARDLKDQAQGVLPRTLRAAGETAHLNGVGYSIVGALVYEWARDHHWFEPVAESRARPPALRPIAPGDLVPAVPQPGTLSRAH